MKGRGFDIYRPKFSVKVDALDRLASRLEGKYYLTGNVCSQTTARGMIASADDKDAFNWLNEFWVQVSPNDIGTSPDFHNLYDFYGRAQYLEEMSSRVPHEFFLLINSNGYNNKTLPDLNP